jgi:neutral ceramidase
MRFFKYFGYVLLLLLGVGLAMVGPIDRTPLVQQPFYADMMASLEQWEVPQALQTDSLHVGWAKATLTPEYALPMAGYRLREKFTHVNDSLFLRVLTVFDGTTYLHFISFDLLIAPPILCEQIRSHVETLGERVFFSATHTHNGVGGWDNSKGGQRMAGPFNPDWVESTFAATLLAIEKAKATLLPAAIAYGEADASEWVANRLRGERKDGLLRALKISRTDDSQAMAYTYSAHPTSISSSSLSLSGDYPAAIHRNLEASGVDFPVFLAGMVGSHRLSGFETQDFERVEEAGRLLGERLMTIRWQEISSRSGISYSRLPVLHGPAQLRLTRHLKLRNYLFEWALGPLEGEITCARVGNILWVGISADFSGEISIQHSLDSVARAHGLELIITSFNGNYTGYITCDAHYNHATKAEVRTMNWVGPGFGDYYAEILKQVIPKFGDVHTEE